MVSEKEVMSVIRAQEDATAKGDARATVDVMGEDVVVFDLPPPLAYRGEQARDIEAINNWFATWRNGVTVRMANPQFIIDGDLAVAFGLSRMTGMKTDGTKVDSWSRRTIVLTRIAGSWKIVHEHASFPMAMDGTGRAVTDLLP
jgi:ketosteroid isomerase-like protein